jgi:hypothetical protein
MQMVLASAHHVACLDTGGCRLDLEPGIFAPPIPFEPQACARGNQDAVGPESEREACQDAPTRGAAIGHASP